jgi:hypothetical protein
MDSNSTLEGWSPVKREQPVRNMTFEAGEKIKFLIQFVDNNVKHRRTKEVFRLLLPSILILTTSLSAIFLVVYQWTSLPLLNWTPGAVSIIAIVLSFYSHAQTTVKSASKDMTMTLAMRLRERLPDKTDTTFCLLIALVALKQKNYPLKLSTLYELNNEMFNPETLAKYYFQ